ncbi:MAG: iron ABC transporter permease [Chloroflexi bacterium]|nr:iron ABC transporter permease [Chloroflexota bacterium]
MQSSSSAAAPGLRLAALLVGVVALFLVSFPLGRYPIPVDTVLGILGSQLVSLPRTWTDTMETVVLQVRLPRILAALLIGAALAASGAAYQNVFTNPLVSPAILGVSAGAGFGAALAIVLQLPWLAVQGSAFVFAIVATGLALLIGRWVGAGSTVVLVLGGLVISALFQALISILQYLANPVDTLPTITFWLMGGLSRVSMRDVLFAVWPVALSCGLLYAVRWQVQVLALGSDEATALGIDRSRVWAIVIVSATLMTATVVSIGGIIGWVGLLVPHMARMVVGPNFPVLLPASILMGGGFLLLVDNIGRSAGPLEIPLGILTALIGAPFFIVLLARTAKV